MAFITESTLSGIDDEQIAAALTEHGTQQEAADALGVSRGALQRALKNRGLSSSAPSRRSTGLPVLTRAHVEAAMLPPNNCRVKTFRDKLDESTQDALDYALGQDKKDLTAAGVRDMLVDAGFPEAEVPGVDAINAHRRGERPCRCKG